MAGLREARPCRQCGESFCPKHIPGPIAKYCSKRCSERYYKAQWRKRNPDAHRTWRLPEKYGITLEDYRAMLAAQDGVCAICKQPETVVMRGQIKPLCIDHDHETGKVRGLLCDGCNTGLGRFKDNPAALRAAARYLKVNGK